VEPRKFDRTSGAMLHDGSRQRSAVNALLIGRMLSFLPFLARLADNTDSIPFSGVFTTEAYSPRSTLRARRGRETWLSAIGCRLSVIWPMMTVIEESRKPIADGRWPYLSGSFTMALEQSKRPNLNQNS
jgi:hypothetical protein